MHDLFVARVLRNEGSPADQLAELHAIALVVAVAHSEGERLDDWGQVLAEARAVRDLLAELDTDDDPVAGLAVTL